MPHPACAAAERAQCAGCGARGRCRGDGVDTMRPTDPPTRNEMTEPTLRHVQCLDPRGLHRMAYWEWGQRGDAANPRVLVCVHGLTRQGRDFDTLARALCGEYRVVCPDVVGRGRSDRLADASGYAFPTYVADMVTLLARLDTDAVDWVGTSMGGLIGLAVASLAGSPVRRLVLNDVGPVAEPAAIERLRGYVDGKPLHWDSVEQAADAMWQVSQGFGPHSREQWLALTEPQLAPDPAGGYTPRCDPAIAVPFLALTPAAIQAGEALWWAAYDKLSIPTLLLRGAESDLLSHRTAVEMTRRGPRAQLREFAGVGHAPTLVHDDQVDAVRRFLLSP
jgi:pimeloyl-ACP methyl ester carboxylesterase